MAIAGGPIFCKHGGESPRESISEHFSSTTTAIDSRLSWDWVFRGGIGGVGFQEKAAIGGPELI